jgi:hypothetical protein
MRYRLGLLTLLVTICGCGPEISKHELGTVVFGDVPKVPGADKPYPLPELGDLPKQDEENPVSRGR